MTNHDELLPASPIYTLTWKIPQTFGGMTGVVLARSSALAEVGGRDSTILTLGTDFDPIRRRDELVATGQLDDRVRIRNAWFDFAHVSDRMLAYFGRSFGRSPGTPTEPDHPELLDYAAAPTSVRTNDEGEELQIDRFRPDGTRFASDVKDPEERGVKKGRRISLFTREGDLVGQWHSATTLYESWLDFVMAGSEAFLIIDSGPAANMLRDYRRDNVAKIVLFHNPHLIRPDDVLSSPIGPGRGPALVEADSFDGVVVLTDQHRTDMLDGHFAIDKVYTVSNMFTGSFGDPFTERNATQGVLLGRLDPQKRIEHAIRAIGLASSDLRLDVYGEGVEEDTLRGEITELGLESRVRLLGYSSRAKDAFLTASFSVLTSRFEGQGLVILESMAAGCIPVAYDIRYGPASIITDGVDGFLVPPGDVEALAVTLDRVANLDPEVLGSMREAAIARAHDFTAEPYVRRWGEVLEDVGRSKPVVRHLTGDARLVACGTSPEGFDLDIEVTGPGLERTQSALLTWIGHEGRIYGREPVVRRDHEFDGPSSTARAIFTGRLPLSRLLDRTEVRLRLFIDLFVEENPLRLALRTSDFIGSPDCGEFRLHVDDSGFIELGTAPRPDLSVPNLS